MVVEVDPNSKGRGKRGNTGDNLQTCTGATKRIEDDEMTRWRAYLRPRTDDFARFAHQSFVGKLAGV